jgi:hypothetical protein
MRGIGSGGVRKEEVELDVEMFLSLPPPLAPLNLFYKARISTPCFQILFSLFKGNEDTATNKFH